MIGCWPVIGFILIVIGVATCQDCTTVGFTRSVPSCPNGTKEVYHEHAFGQTRKRCCKPDTEGEAFVNKLANRCRVTKCDQPTTDPCFYLYKRYYKNEELEYEEVSRETCTTSVGATGESAYCCRKNSTEGLLATTYGAEQNEFPHIALLDLGGGQCGGTIYNKRYIITAAHCIVDKETTELRQPDETWIAKLGRNIGSVEMPENDYIIEEAIPHENYSRMQGSPELEQEAPLIYNDVALLRVNRDIVFGPNVKSIPLAPEGFNELQYADKAVIVGWGTTDTLDVSDNLQKADFVIRTDRTCFRPNDEAPWPEQFNRTEQLLCVGGVREGIWSPTAGAGDSGGPAVCRGADGMAVLCGITSFGASDEDCAAHDNEEHCLPSVYAEVDNFRGWFLEKAGEQDESTFYRVPLYGEQPNKSRRDYHVRITSDEGKACGGTLVADDMVVTAAQCVSPGDDSGRMYSGLTVTSEINNLKSNPKGKTHRIKGVTILDGFKRNGKEINLKEQGNRIRIIDRYHTNDLAAIKLEEKVALKTEAFPLLPEFDDRPVNPAYELAFPKNTSRGGQLQQRQFTILDRAECQRRMNRLQRVNMKIEVDDTILCGVEKYSGGSSCDRELGGGLICKGRNGRDTLCGVQIFRLCEWSIPNGFLNMALYADWVQEASRQL